MNRADLEALGQKEKARQGQFSFRILCCSSTPCLSSGVEEVKQALKQTIAEEQIPAKVEIVATGCLGMCSRGPMLAVVEEGKEQVIYERVTAEVAKQLVRDHIKQGKLVEEFVTPQDLPFFTKQKKVVLANSGLIDPEKIEDYAAKGGYRALYKAVREMTPEEVCKEMISSGLRGRGGAGFPTGLKWDMVRKENSEAKYVVANGDEGDPGAYMDRTLMESDPHRIVEGMAIAGYAVGASQGFIYVRAEYPVAAACLEKAIKQAEKYGLLGNGIFETGFNFKLEIRMGAGAFVCGEETALLASVMGRRGQPVPRPPYPAQSGLWGKPTLINNVETFGCITAIINKGAAWYSSIGTAKSKGTKIFALAGKVNITGLIEVPMGISVREIVFDIGGGIPNGAKFKAAQTGGPSGGCIPSQHLDTPVDYESLRDLGSIMGSGGLIVMDEHNCMVDVAKFFMEFCEDESCGKCVPCRVGTVQMRRILESISNGSATSREVEILKELCSLVKETSLCGLGQSAPNPVLSTLRYFADEYLAHVNERRCPAGVCVIDKKPLVELGHHDIVVNV